MMRYLLFSLTIGTCFLGLGQTPKNHTENELNILTEVDFEEIVLTYLRAYSTAKIAPAVPHSELELAYNEKLEYQKFIDRKITGIRFVDSNQKAIESVGNLRLALKPLGYQIYISDDHYSHEMSQVTILKTDDQFDQLRFEGTNGINYDLGVEDVIEKLLDWHQKYGLEIIESGFNYVAAFYLEFPKDITSHCKALYKFCPDIVDQGTETVEALVEEMIDFKRLYLWWD